MSGGRKSVLAAVVTVGLCGLTAQSTSAPTPPDVTSPAAVAAPAAAVPSPTTPAPTPPTVEPSPAAQPDYQHILGVIPNYQSVEDPTLPYKPLTTKQKYELFVRQSIDPFTFAGAAMGAAISHAENESPKYGEGPGAYAERFGAAVTDIATQNFFSGALLASLLHEDPRYFRRGPEYPFFNRVGYALAHIVITRKDSGREGFNYSGVLGMSMGIALSNAYYPESSVNAPEFGSRVVTSLLSAALGNLLPEFWPDVHDKIFRHHH